MCSRSGMHISWHKNAHIPDALFLLNRRARKQKKAKSTKGTWLKFAFPFPPAGGAEWRTKRMHAHVNSPSASARKLGKRVRKIVEKLVGIWVGGAKANDMNLPHGSEKCAKSEKSVGEKEVHRNFAIACNFPLHFSWQLSLPPDPQTHTYIHTHMCVWHVSCLFHTPTRIASHRRENSEENGICEGPSGTPLFDDLVAIWRRNCCN